MNKLGLAVAVVVAVVAGPASAGPVTLISNVADVSANQTLDWSVLGSDGATVSNPFNYPGKGAIVSQNSGSFSLSYQGVSWFGGFPDNQALLWTGGDNGGPLSIEGKNKSSGQGVEAIGAQIQADAFGAFTAHLQAFDTLGNSLGVVTEASGAGPSGDSSAIFIGVKSSSFNINKVTFSIDGTGDFALGTVYLHTSDSSDRQSSPEPASLTLMSLAALGLAGYGWRQRRRQA